MTCSLMPCLQGSFRFAQLWIRLLEKVHIKRCLLVDVSRERSGVSLAWRASDGFGKEVRLGSWEQEGTLYVALSQFSHLWDLEEQRGSWGEVLKSSYGEGGKPQKEDHFYRTPLDTINMLFCCCGASLSKEILHNVNLYQVRTFVADLSF